MALVRLLLAQMDMHDAGAGIERGPGLARHLLGRDRHVVLLRVGQHAVQRAGDDGLVAHGMPSEDAWTSAIIPAGSTGFLRQYAIRTAAGIDRKIARAGED